MEIWKDVVGYEGLYMVSSNGRVKSLSRKVINNGGIYTIRECIRKTQFVNGYERLELWKDKIGSKRFVHSLVAEAFLMHNPNVTNLVVNHIDFDRANNNLSNLELITQRENSNQAHRDSSSKYVGVDIMRGKFRARITIDGKLIHIGVFSDEHDAHLAYQAKLNEVNYGKTSS